MDEPRRDRRRRRAPLGADARAARSLLVGAAARARRPVRGEELPRLPAHPGADLRDRAARPQPADRLQRPDLARPRRLLRHRRLHRRDPDGPARRAVLADAAGRRRWSASSSASCSACRRCGSRAIYLALATFALGVAVPQILKYKASSTGPAACRASSSSSPTRPFGLPLNQDQWLYFFTLAVAVAAVLSRPRNLLREPHRPRHDGDPRPSDRGAARWASTPRSTRR